MNPKLLKVLISLGYRKLKDGENLYCKPVGVGCIIVNEQGKIWSQFIGKDKKGHTWSTGKIKLSKTAANMTDDIAYFEAYNIKMDSGYACESGLTTFAFTTLQDRINMFSDML